MTNKFDRVDDIANICEQLKLKCASNDFGQQKHSETRRGCLKSFPKNMALMNIFAPFIQRVLCMRNVSCETIFICNTKVNTPNCHFFFLLIYTRK